MKSSKLVLREVARGRERVDPRAPQRLVGVDVPDPGDGALVEDRGLDGRASCREPLCQITGAERRFERLASDPRIDVLVHLGRLEKEPRAEPPDVTVGK